ncbi:MAG: hypothetical protein D6765_15105 [Bacteroidetes bacterium]|nr:MAG: hypothetical protein D6765_15105 [Bacteroidota bacterium]
MKNLSFFVLAFFLLAFAWACSGGGEGSGSSEDRRVEVRQEQMWDSVMAIHDEVMPQMAEVNRLSRQLKALDPESQDPEVQELLQHLSAVDEFMMQWMSEFKQLEALRESKTHQEIMQYLAEEYRKMGQLKQETQRALEAAREFLKLRGEAAPEGSSGG